MGQCVVLITTFNSLPIELVLNPPGRRYLPRVVSDADRNCDLPLRRSRLEVDEITVFENPMLGFVQNIEVTDLDDDGLPEGMVKFLWSDVKDLLEPGLNDLTCAGQFVDGQRFVAKGSVRVSE